MGKANGYRIRIWRTDTGELVHELFPHEQTTCEAVSGLIWTLNGKYLLAGVDSQMALDEEVVGVWSVATGRHLVEFTGSTMPITGFTLLPDQQTLVVGCGDGRLRLYDLKAAWPQIIEYEQSLKEFDCPGK